MESSKNLTRLKSEMDQATPKIKSESDVKIKIEESDPPIDIPLVQAEQKAPASRVIIDPTGDLFLRMWNEELRVSSKILSHASTKFREMLSSTQAGSTVHKIGGHIYATISVPPDETASMRDMCNLLHLNWDDVTPRIGPGNLWRVVKIANRYDCIKAIKPWASLMVSKLVVSPQIKGGSHMTRLLYPAYALDLADEFHQITRNLIHASEPLYPAFHGTAEWDFGNGVPELLPSSLLGKSINPDHMLVNFSNPVIVTITIRQQELKRSILEAVEALIQEPLNGKRLGSTRDHIPRDMVARGRHQDSYLSHHPSALSECDCIKVALIVWELNNRGLWPLSRLQRDLSAESIVKKLQDFAIVRGSEANPSCATCQIDIERRISRIVQDADARASKGICLDCAKAPHGTQKAGCRVKHDGFLGIYK